MIRTDKASIIWPSKTSHSDRVHCRKMINAIRDYLESDSNIIVAFSGGIDSVVLAHALSKACLVYYGEETCMSLCYINHNLRKKEELEKEIDFIRNYSDKINFNLYIESVRVPEGNIQDQAREVRYNALCGRAAASKSNMIMLAHHSNDVAETRLFQFLTGRPVNGIKKQSVRKYEGKDFNITRPLLDFTREDIVHYAKVWGLEWTEDSSNCTDKYTRNKIRHHLIPWIEQNINPGFVGMAYDE